MPADESEICCQKLVIETVVHGGKFYAQVLETNKNDDLPSMRLDEKRLPEGSKTIKLSWFAITFESKARTYTFVPRLLNPY